MSGTLHPDNSHRDGGDDASTSPPPRWVVVALVCGAVLVVVVVVLLLTGEHGPSSHASLSGIVASPPAGN